MYQQTEILFGFGIPDGQSHDKPIVAQGDRHCRIELRGVIFVNMDGNLLVFGDFQYEVCKEHLPFMNTKIRGNSA